MAPLVEELMLCSAVGSREWSYGIHYLGLVAEKESRWKVAEVITRRAALRYLRGYVNYNALFKSRDRAMKADIYLARQAAERGDRERAIELFQHCFDNVPGMVQLADDFFPMARESQLIEEHDQWFAQGYEISRKRFEKVPRSPNGKNSLAWLCSRALKNLDEAEKLVSEAVEVEPKNYAYIHTLGEVYLAKGNMDQAMEFCEKANDCGSLLSAQMREELDRFRKIKAEKALAE